jgi:hypothetical protein
MRITLSNLFPPRVRVDPEDSTRTHERTKPPLTPSSSPAESTRRVDHQRAPDINCHQPTPATLYLTYLQGHKVPPNFYLFAQRFALFIPLKNSLVAHIMIVFVLVMLLPHGMPCTHTWLTNRFQRSVPSATDLFAARQLCSFSPSSPSLASLRFVHSFNRT